MTSFIAVTVPNFFDFGSKTSESYPFNPNKSGLPANSKGVPCWYFNTNWCWSFNTKRKRQKRLTLRARLRYFENSDQHIKFSSCRSLYALSWSKNWGQSFKILYRDFATKKQNEKVFKDRWGGPVFIRFFTIFVVKMKLFWSSYKIQKEWSYNLWPISDFCKNI